MEVFQENFIKKEDFEPIDTNLFKEYLADSFLNILGQVNLHITPNRCQGRRRHCSSMRKVSDS